MAALMLPLGVKTSARCVADGNLALCVVLYHLATPSRQDRQAAFFGKSSAWVSQVYSSAIRILHAIARRHFGQWSADLPMVIPKFVNAMSNQSGGVLQNVWGLADGSKIKISRPSAGQDIAYNGFEKAHVLRLLGVVRLDGLFERVYGPIPGSATDMTIFNHYHVEDELERLHSRRENPLANIGRVKVFGDSGFSHSINMEIPHAHALAQAAPAMQLRAFNLITARARIPNEWSFGRVVNTFRTLEVRSALKIHWTQPEKAYLVAMLLTNFVVCRDGAQHEEYFGVAAPSFEEYLDEVQHSV